MKLIRLDEDHFAYLIDDMSMSSEELERIVEGWHDLWPGKRLIVLRADEFVDLTGKAEVVPAGASEGVADHRANWERVEPS